LKTDFFATVKDTVQYIKVSDSKKLGTYAQKYDLYINEQLGHLVGVESLIM